MMSTLERIRTSHLAVAYGLSWGGLYWLNSYVARALTGGQLSLPSLRWWFIQSAYLALDTLIVIAFALTVNARRGRHLRASVPYILTELIPIWFIFHAFLTTSEYPLWSRLKTVGLSAAMELIMFAAFAIVLIGSICRRVVMRESCRETQVADNDDLAV